MADNFENGVYSFLGVELATAGPNFNLAVTGAADEGYSFEWDADSSTLTMGAGGDGMHSQRAAQNGTITIRLLKTAVLNQAFDNAFWYQRGSPSLQGRNTLRLTDNNRGDIISGYGAAFRKHPNAIYGVEGGMNEWVFNCTRLTSKLGSGVGTVIIV